MENNEKSLEGRAKEFFKLNFKGYFTIFNPVDVDNLDECIPMINYLLENKYISEKGKMVKTFHYVSTFEGRRWAKK